jgi:hypothetical protein
VWRGGYADGGGYLIRCFFAIEEVLGGGALPDAPGFTTGRRPARASFLGVRSLNLVLADFGTLLFCFFLVVIFYSLSFLFCFFGAITVTFRIIRIRANLSKVSKELNELPAFSVIQQALMQRSVPKDFIANGKDRGSV